MSKDTLGELSCLDHIHTFKTYWISVFPKTINDLRDSCSNSVFKPLKKLHTQTPNFLTFLIFSDAGRWSVFCEGEKKSCLYEKPLNTPCLYFRSGAWVRHVQAVLVSWATPRVATFHLQVRLMGALSKWTFQWNFCVLILFWLGSWYSLNAGQNANPHIRTLRFINYETSKMLSVAAFARRILPVC